MTGIRAKLGWLWRTLQLEPIPPDLRSAVELLADVRNEHVHYKWKDHDPDVLTPEDSRLKLAIADTDSVIEGLIDFEIGTLIAPFIAIADRLFKVSVATDWRAQALTRPTSAPRLAES